MSQALEPAWDNSCFWDAAAEAADQESCPWSSPQLVSIAGNQLMAVLRLRAKQMFVAGVKFSSILSDQCWSWDKESKIR